ncbi:MAG TPA: NAD(P)H-binding protein [Blastocatellia bacterium]
MAQRKIFIAGGTGYIGKRLIPELLKKGHEVTALVRKGSESKAPEGCRVVTGDPLDRATFSDQISPADTFIQLVGVPHPSPTKAAQFRAIDLVSARESVAAAKDAAIKHFIYVSVAHPAPAMKAYIEVRSQGEEMINRSGMNATILRPWYVLGPGHRWPYALVPFYWLLERIPSTRETALRLGLVTLSQMVNAIISAVETPVEGIHIFDVPRIRSGSQLIRSITAAKNPSEL